MVKITYGKTVSRLDITLSKLFLLPIILICSIIVIIFRINVEINNITIVFNEFCQFLYLNQFLVLIFSTRKDATTGKALRDVSL